MFPNNLIGGATARLASPAQIMLLLACKGVIGLHDQSLGQPFGALDQTHTVSTVR